MAVKSSTKGKSRTSKKSRSSTSKSKPRTSSRSRTPSKGRSKSSSKSRTPGRGRSESSSSARTAGKGRSKSASSQPRTTPRSRSSSSYSATRSQSSAGATSTRTDREAAISSLRYNFERVVPLITLAAVSDQIEDLTNTVSGLDNQVHDLRSRGYIFEPAWEMQVSDLQSQWDERSHEAQTVLNRERRTLESTLRTVEDAVERAVRNYSLVDSADSRVDALERRAREARRRVEGSYDQTAKEISQLHAEISRARSLLELLDGASFRLYPDEHGYRASKAAWEPQGNEPIEGLLFLTDSRLIFEQRQEVATKKFLFITTEKKMVQELLWHAPVGGVEVLEVEDQKRFMRRNRELLILRLEGGDGPPEITVNLQEDTNEEWRRLLQRARDGDLVVAEKPETPGESLSGTSPAPEPAVIPTECPNCGAPLPTFYQGMHQITCEYCGATVSVE